MASTDPITREETLRVFNYLGLPAREADLEVCQAIGGTRGHVAEYIWDHWLGEPEVPSLETVEAAVEEAFDA